MKKPQMKLPLTIASLALVHSTFAQINPEASPKRTGFVFSVPYGSEHNVPNSETRYYYPSPYMPDPEKDYLDDVREYLRDMIASLQWFVTDYEERPPRHTVSHLKERHEQVQKARELVTKSQSYLGDRL